MATISADRFGGSIHKNALHLISQPYASYALNAKLTTGRLSSFNDTEPVADDDSMQLEWGEKWIQVGCCWIKVPQCVDFADGAVECNSYYFTGRSEYPEEAILDTDTCELDFYRLGLPCPTQPPTVAYEDVDCDPPDCADPADGCLNKDAEARVYVYQFVNSRGQRSQVSPPSTIELVNDGTQAIVSGWEIPDDSWDIQTIRIYRAVSGFQESNNTVNNVFDTTYMFVGEIPITEQYFVDDLRNYELSDALEEDTVTPPPTNLKGIHRISGMNVLVGYAGNRLYFTYNNQWWNWGIEMALEDNIRAITESAGLVYVATDGVPYVVTGTADCNSAECRQVIKFKSPYPYIGCNNKGMQPIENGAVYPTHDGLVMLYGNSEPTLITSNIYSEEQWRDMRPDTAMPVYYKGKLFVFLAEYAFVIDLKADKGSMDIHSSLSDTHTVYAFVARTGEMYIERLDNTYIWERSHRKRQHIWRTPIIRMQRGVAFSHIKVECGQGQEFVKVTMDKKTMLEREVRPDYAMSLPLWARGQDIMIELSGDADVTLMTMATSYSELL